MSVIAKSPVLTPRTQPPEVPLRAQIFHSKLEDFIGSWRLSRSIWDLFANKRGHFSGLATFTRQGNWLAYCETGILNYGDSPPMAAERRFMWAADDVFIAVRFADGRLFHRFDPTDSVPRATHDCMPDRYFLRYEFTGWPHWRMHTEVAGPRKDYHMITDYEPDTA